MRYQNVNAIIGALECAKLELYRRLIAPYEDTKVEKMEMFIDAGKVVVHVEYEVFKRILDSETIAESLEDIRMDLVPPNDSVAEKD